MARRKKIVYESDTKSVRVGNTSMEVYYLQLKDIKFYPDMSDETLAFNADLYIVTPQEVVVCKCKNNGCGGSTDVNVYHEDVDTRKRWLGIMFETDEALKKVPDTAMEAHFKALGFELDNVPMMDLESMINQMLAEWADKYGL